MMFVFQELRRTPRLPARDRDPAPGPKLPAGLPPAAPNRL